MIHTLFNKDIDAKPGRKLIAKNTNGLAISLFLETR